MLLVCVIVLCSCYYYCSLFQLFVMVRVLGPRYCSRELCLFCVHGTVLVRVLCVCALLLCAVIARALCSWCCAAFFVIGIGIARCS